MRVSYSYCSEVLVGLNRSVGNVCGKSVARLLFLTLSDHSKTKHVSYVDYDSRDMMPCYVYICLYR